MLFQSEQRVETVSPESLATVWSLPLTEALKPERPEPAGPALWPESLRAVALGGPRFLLPVKDVALQRSWLLALESSEDTARRAWLRELQGSTDAVERFDLQSGLRVSRVAVPSWNLYRWHVPAAPVLLTEDGGVLRVRDTGVADRCDGGFPAECERTTVACVDRLSPSGDLTSFDTPLREWEAGDRITLTGTVFHDDALLVGSLWGGGDCEAGVVLSLPGLRPARRGWVTPWGNTAWQLRPVD